MDNVLLGMSRTMHEEKEEARESGDGEWRWRSRRGKEGRKESGRNDVRINGE